jgi:hypothetical protein
MSISKVDRIRIVRDHAKRHGGKFVPASFVDEVQETGPSHPAYDEFDWDDTSAAHAHRIWQARVFAQGIKIEFTIQTIGADRKLQVRETQAPLVISPMNGRKDNDGYIVFNHQNQSHIEELCEQAARDLKSWLLRYEYAMLHVGVDTSVMNELVARLERGESPLPQTKPRKTKGKTDSPGRYART